MEPTDDRWVEVVAQLSALKAVVAELKERRTVKHNEFRERLGVLENLFAAAQVSDLHVRMRVLEQKLITMQVRSNLISAGLATATGIIATIITHLIVSRLP